MNGLFQIFVAGIRIYYLIMTRNIGTPFNDTLNTIQRQIKTKSAIQRKKIFMNGLLIGIGIIFLTKPFYFHKKC